MKKIIIYLFLGYLVLSFLNCSKQKDISQINWELKKEIKLKNNIRTKYPVIYVFDNNLYVIDDMDYKIKCFDMNGNLLDSFGQKGSAPGEFLHINSGFSTFYRNSVFVSDDRLERITKLNFIDEKFQLGQMTKAVVSLKTDFAGDLYGYNTFPHGEKAYLILKYSKDLRNIDRKYFEVNPPKDRSMKSIFKYTFTNFDINKYNDLFMIDAREGIIEKYKFENEDYKKTNIFYNGDFKRKFEIPDKLGNFGDLMLASEMYDRTYMTNNSLIVRYRSPFIEGVNEDNAIMKYYVFDFELNLLATFEMLSLNICSFTDEFDKMYVLKNDIFQIYTKK